MVVVVVVVVMMMPMVVMPMVVMPMVVMSVAMVVVVMLMVVVMGVLTCDTIALKQSNTHEEREGNFSLHGMQDTGIFFDTSQVFFYLFNAFRRN